MPDPLWFGPPESVAALLEGSNPSTVIANIAAWLSEAVSHELSMGVSIANIAATMEQWIGLGGAASALKGTELNFAGLVPMVAHCLKHVTIGHAAVEANTIARSAVIPAAVCQSNRDETAALYSTNFCGCNAIPIATLEDQYYGHFWPNNMSAGLAYASTLTTLMAAITSTPPPITPMGASPAAAAAPAETVGETAANSGLQASSGVGDAAGEAGSPGSSVMDQFGSLLGPAQSLLSSASEPMNQLASAPTQLFQNASQSFSSPLQALMGTFQGAMSPPSATAAEALPAETVAGSMGAGGGAAGSLGSAGGGVGVGYPGAGLTSFTRPTSTFEPETAGRPTGLRPSGLLNVADVRGPTTTAATAGPGMPVSPAAAGMSGRESIGEDKDKVTHARIVVDGDKRDPQ
jgi:PPE-repeat protein